MRSSVSAERDGEDKVTGNKVWLISELTAVTVAFPSGCFPHCTVWQDCTKHCLSRKNNFHRLIQDIEHDGNTPSQSSVFLLSTFLTVECGAIELFVDFLHFKVNSFISSVPFVFSSELMLLNHLHRNVLPPQECLKYSKTSQPPLMVSRHLVCFVVLV